VDTLLSLGPASSLPAARVTRTVPMVIFDGVWPVELGLIDSFRRPGHNGTGMAAYAGIEITTRRPEFLRQIVTTSRYLAWAQPDNLLHPETVSGSHINRLSQPEAAAKQHGFESRFCPISRTQAILLAEHVDHMLRGARLVAPPVERQRRCELAINCMTPNARALSVPQSLRARTDEIIRGNAPGCEHRRQR
jgi:hypothetical protein